MEITSNTEFETSLTNKFVFVDFYADWCGPCKKFAPTFSELAKKYEKDCKFVKINIDNLEEIAEKYSITQLPTFMLFSNGASVGSVIGANKDNVEIFLQNKVYNKTAICEDF